MFVMPWVMFLAFVASLAVPILAVIALVTHLRRRRQFPRGESGGHFEGAVLDSLDQVHLRLEALNDRLTRLEHSVDEARRDLLNKSQGDVGERLIGTKTAGET